MPSSLVSYAKTDINEMIPGMQCSNYSIPASDGMPSVLVIDNSYYFKPDLDGNQDRVLVVSEDIANSVVHMHITSQLLYRIDQHPAFFALPGVEIEPKDVEKRFEDQVKDALKKQRNWFVALVKLADDDWQVARRHQMISGIQRIAAKELGLQREWLFDLLDEEKKAGCPFCGTVLIDANAPICPACGKVHNPSRLADLEAMVTARGSKSK